MTEPLNRREFLKLVAVGVAVAAGVKGEISTNPEYVLNSQVLVPDFFDVPAPQNSNILATIPQTNEEIREAMSDYYVQKFGQHGNDVVGVMQTSAARLGSSFIKKDVTLASIVPGVSILDIQKDSIGNVSATAEISEAYVENLISKSSAGIVNISFEIGKFNITGRFYERKMTDEEIDKFNSMGFTGIKINGRVIYKSAGGKTYSEAEYYKLLEDFSSGPIVELGENDRSITHEDGYSRENVYDNLKKLSDIARNHPDKFFVAAGGNPDTVTGKRPDIREARKLLEKDGLWPSNLIIVGYVDKHPYSGQIEPMQFGADYYIGGMEASSFATAYTTELIKKLVGEGAVKSSLIKSELQELSTVKSVDPTDSIRETVEYRLLN